MNYYSKENIFNTFLKFVECSSISGTKEEIDMAYNIYDTLSQVDYFKRNKSYLKLNKIENDKLGRYTVTALLKGKGNKTVILLNHFDIVDYEGFGIYKDYAIHPIELMKKINIEHLDNDAKTDFLSGNWLFGRGTGDMKFGLALETALISELSQSESFDGNIILLCVPDEENNSAGMLSALTTLNQMREEYSLEFVAVVNNEPHQVNNNRHNIDLGSVGKLLPAFFCVGKEGHSGLIFEAFNAATLLSEVIREMEFNLDFIDNLHDIYTYPATALKLEDTKVLYNVSMPYISYVYYTVSTLTYSPADVTKKLIKVAEKAFNNTIEKYEKFTKDYYKLTGEFHQSNLKSQIYTYDEFYNITRERLGLDFNIHMDEFIKQQQLLDIDEREMTVNIVEEVIRLNPDKEPKIIIAYMPPYYTHSINNEKTCNEIKVLNCAKAINKYSKEKYGEEWEVVRVCKQLSDISYCNSEKMDDTLHYLKPNMPVLGSKYFLPIEDLDKFKVPAINIGHWAKDFHQNWERINLPFALDVLPDLLYFALKYLLDDKNN